MASPIETSFGAWRLSLEEIQQARTLTPEQKMYFQTLMTDAAESKLALVLDPYKPLLYTQQEAYLRGQMDILAMLLDPAGTKISLPQNAVTQTQPSNPTGE